MSQTVDTLYSIRIFLPADIELYKAMRLEALQLEPRMFSSNYEREAAFSGEQWMARIEGAKSACFGLFYGDELIGLTGIVIDWDDDSLAHMTQSYIRSDHRGKGLSRLLYEARLQWASAKPGLKTLRIGHRESNIISKSANQHFGFNYAYREPLVWPDGIAEDILYYHLQI